MTRAQACAQVLDLLLNSQQSKVRMRLIQYFSPWHIVYAFRVWSWSSLHDAATPEYS